MKVGCQVSITVQLVISNSSKNAESIGYTTFQIFTRNPSGWTAKQLEINDINEFKKKKLYAQ